MFPLMSSCQLMTQDKVVQHHSANNSRTAYPKDSLPRPLETTQNPLPNASILVWFGPVVAEIFTISIFPFLHLSSSTTAFPPIWIASRRSQNPSHIISTHKWRHWNLMDVLWFDLCPHDINDSWYPGSQSCAHYCSTTIDPKDSLSRNQESTWNTLSDDP